MSTNINITVGGNTLVDQAKAQQIAARQAQNEKENRQRVGEEAAEQREERLRREGKDANGNPLFGTPAAKPTLKEEPAAFRRPSGVPGDLFYFTQAPGSSTLGRFGSYVINPSLRLDKNKLTPSTRANALDPETPIALHNFLAIEPSLAYTFAAGGGPFNQNAISFPAREASSRVEWTNVAGVLTNFDGTTEWQVLNEPAQPQLTLEYDMLLGGVDDVSTGAVIRLWADIENTNTDQSPSSFPENTSISFTLETSPDDFYASGISSFRLLDVYKDFSKPTEQGWFADFPFSDAHQFPGGRLWRRMSLTVTSNAIYLHQDGVLLYNLTIDPIALQGYEAVGWLIDGASISQPPSVSAVRFTQKALYGASNYTPSSLLRNPRRAVSS